MSDGRKVRASIFATLCCIAVPAYASTTSEMHRTKAISALGDGQLEQARGELERAVLADENDLHARFYRGIVYSRLGDYKKAADDLKAVMQADLPYQNLHFELGYAEFHLERLVPAKEELLAAIEQKGDFAPAQYYLGVVLYQLKEYEACLAPLEIATSLDSDFAAPASFMRGDALIYLGRGEEAEPILTTAINTYPDSIYTEYSIQALARLKEDRREERRWDLEVTAGGSYDTNVGLFADDRALPAGIESEEDWRAQFALDGRYRAWEEEQQSISAGYRLFQSLHQDLSDYDMQNHTFSGDYRLKREQQIWGVNLQYVVTRLANEAYRNSAVLSPYLIWEHGQQRSSLFKLRVADEQYQQDDQEPRDGTTYEGQYRHYWLGGKKRYYFAGLRLNRDDAKDEQYSYSGYGVEGGLQRTWENITVSAELFYQRRGYESDSPSRDDDYGKGDIKVSYPLQEDLTLEGNLSHIRNQSTNDDYDYNRTVVNMMLRWQL